MHNKRILFLSHAFYPSIGGIETFSELLAHSFTNAGYNVHLLTWTLDKDGREFPFKVIRNPSIIRLLKEHAWADIVFENNPCIRLGFPKIIFNNKSIVVLQTWLDSLDKDQSILSKIKKFWLMHADQVVAISDSVRQRCWPQAVVVPNSYNNKTFKVFTNQTKIKDFVFVGRLVSDKGADIAIRALYQLYNKTSKRIVNQKFFLTIIGDGPEKKSLEKLVQELNLEDSICFTGSLRGEAISLLLNQHRFLIVPSVWEEPFGIVALEGLASGCIPLVSNSGGLPEAVGQAGFVFEKGNVESLVTTIMDVMFDTSLESSLKKVANIHLKKHQPEVISERYLNLLNELLTR